MSYFNFLQNCKFKKFYFWCQRPIWVLKLSQTLELLMLNDAFSLLQVLLTNLTEAFNSRRFSLFNSMLGKLLKFNSQFNELHTPNLNKKQYNNFSFT